MELKKLLIVDDTPENLDVLVHGFGEEYEIQAVLDGVSAVQAVQEETPDLILLDVMMPEMNGMEVLEILKGYPEYADIPVIFLTAMSEVSNKTKGFELGAVDYITKPFHLKEVQARVRTHLALREAQSKLARQNEILEEKVKERTRELALTREATLHCLAAMAETKDPETGGHILRTQSYVKILSTRLKDHPNFQGRINQSFIDLLTQVAPLHDIGKVGIPDAILMKPGKLTEEEFEAMKEHCLMGKRSLNEGHKLLGQSSFFQMAEEVAESHHEKWDGTGYPHALAGEEIPLAARIMAIADVYDALICKRVYKNPMPHAKAVSIIVEGAGKHFDPVMVECFQELVEDFRQAALRHVDFEEERQALQSTEPA